MKKRRLLTIIVLGILITAFLYPNVCKKRDVKTDTQKTQRDTSIKQEGFSDEPTRFAQSRTITIPDVLEMRKQQEREAAYLMEQLISGVPIRERVIVHPENDPSNHWIVR